MNSTWDAMRFECMGDTEESGHARCRDQMMTTRMSYIRQCIIFSIYTDQPSTLATQRFESCLDTICFTSDCESLFFQKVAECVVGDELFKGELGVVVNLYYVSFIL